MITRHFLFAATCALPCLCFAPAGKLSPANSTNDHPQEAGPGTTRTPSSLLLALLWNEVDASSLADAQEPQTPQPQIAAQPHDPPTQRANETEPSKEKQTELPKGKETDLPKDQVAEDTKKSAADPDLAPALSRDELCGTLVTAARDNQLPVGFFTSLIWQESRFNHKAVSPAGAQGVAQFMPKVAEEHGLDNPFDAREALPASARFLRLLKDKFGGNLGLAAAAYNAGARRVAEWLAKRGPLPLETRSYVHHVTGRPADTWDDANPRVAVFRVASQVPCHRVAAFARVEKAERQQMEAQAAAEAAETRRIAQLKARQDLAHRRLAAAQRLTAKRRHAITVAQRNPADIRVAVKIAARTIGKVERAVKTVLRAVGDAPKPLRIAAHQNSAAKKNLSKIAKRAPSGKSVRFASR